MAKIVFDFLDEKSCCDSKKIVRDNISKTKIDVYKLDDKEMASTAFSIVVESKMLEYALFDLYSVLKQDFPFRISNNETGFSQDKIKSITLEMNSL